MLGCITTDACLVHTLSLGTCFRSLLKMGCWARWAFSPSQSSSSCVLLSVCALGNVFFVHEVRMSMFQGRIHSMEFQCSLSQQALAERSLIPAYSGAAGLPLASAADAISLDSRVAHNCTPQGSVQGETGEVLKWALLK